jgi:hypothetical protein
MRFRVPEIFLGAFLAVAVFAMGMMFSSQNSRQLAQTNSPEKSEQAADHKGEPKGFWRTASADPLAAFTLALVVVGLAQAGLFFVQLRLIRESLAPAKEAANAAKDAAEAAKLNADALMIAEAAQIYLIVVHSNIDRLYQLGGMYNNSPTMHPSPSDPPWVEYRLRNYGKSPAIVQSVFHGIAIYNPNADRSPLRDYKMGQDGMEIIGVAEQGQVLKCEFDRPFTFGDVRSIMTEDQLLSFFGHAVFIDHYGRRQTLEWEFIADDWRWNLIAHRNTRDN